MARDLTVVAALRSPSYPAWNAWIVGVIIAVAAASALVAFHKWEEWLNVVLALWLVISPWILGFGALMTARMNQLVIGIPACALALWSTQVEHESRGLTT